jgi:hypothetical protein
VPRANTGRRASDQDRRRERTERRIPSVTLVCAAVMRGQKRVEDARERAYDPRIHLTSQKLFYED